MEKSDNKKKTIIALKKANTLTQKILTMLEEDKYCIDIIQQVLAVIGLLRSTNLTLLEEHMNCCVKNAIKEQDGDKLDQMMAELLKVMQTAQKK